jgi:hypothetical protein
VPNDRLLSRTPDGSWALLVRPLPALTGLAALVAGQGLWLITLTAEARSWRDDTLMMERAWVTLAAVVVATAVAIAWTRAFTALVAALIAVLACWGNRFDYDYGWVESLPWSPWGIASTGLMVLAGSLSMLAMFRAVDRNASTPLRRSLVELTTGTRPGRTLLAVGFAGIVMVLAAQGVRHSANDRSPLPPEVAIGLAVLLVVTWWLLLTTGGWATSYLVPIVWAAAGLAAAPFAVGRLWSYWPAEHFDTATYFDPVAGQYVRFYPARYLFEPESGNVGAVASCLLMAVAAVALLALRVRRGRGTR